MAKKIVKEIARKTYSKELKKIALDKVLKEGRPVIDVARELDIHPVTLSRWKIKEDPDSRNHHVSGRYSF